MRFDPINDLVLSLIGTLILCWLWYAGYIPTELVKAILTEGI